ncbi:hypothetical protein EVAR_96332_1 [Eumeta japonica]|uniref:Uncharacterized protein n=1 Tax=Eumeta variegata TaxID=151549 RepID=A0A4C1VWV3_EUMVA|nr:hypothetical protein EVAR_96332_1 [Eumeta japonica]
MSSPRADAAEPACRRGMDSFGGSRLLVSLAMSSSLRLVQGLMLGTGAGRKPSSPALFLFVGEVTVALRIVGATAWLIQSRYGRSLGANGIHRSWPYDFTLQQEGFSPASCVRTL